MKHCCLKKLGCAILFAASLQLDSHAATNGFFVPYFRGSANSEAGYWESFTVREGPPGNLADRPGATTGAVLTQTAPGTIPLSSGNIYSPTAITIFNLVDATPFTLGTVVLQIHTGAGGNELDYGSMLFSYTDGTGTHNVSPSVESELDRSNGVSHFWQWNLTGLDITSYRLDFRTALESTSFDAMTLDTWNQFTPVPEPSTLGLASLGIGALAVSRSRKKARAAIR
jgi:PEP-CTERM motif-containing protein